MKLAIYDIDYTIISVNSLSSFYFYLFKKNPIKTFYIPFLAFVTIIWVLRLISTKRVKELWLTPLKKLNKIKLDDIAKDFIKESIVPKIKDGVRKNIEENRQKGYTIIFASASFEFYIKYIADELKADYCFGTKIMTNDNKINNKLDGENCRGKEKIKRILELIPEKSIDKNSSIAYSDSNSDYPFLELAKTFYKIKMKKWEVSKVITKEHK